MEKMNDIEFKSTFDEIEFDIAMKMYMKHNSKIASINEHLGEMYSYKDLEDAEVLETYETLQEYKKALKEKCDAFDKAIEYIHNNQIVFELSDRKGIQKWFDKFYKELLDILRGRR